MSSPKIPDPPALAANGWTFYEKCRCQYVLKYKYRNAAFPGLELEWRPRYADFKITDRNMTKVGYTNVGEMDNVLKVLK